jgi:Carboxypeptidase regulatory-like domain
VRRRHIRAYDARVRNRVPLVVGLVALVGIAVLVWWLRRGDGPPAKSTGGSAAVTQKSDRPAARPPAQPASVSGKVTRKADGTGVAAAVVSLARAELGASFSQVTVPTIIVSADANGAWEAKGVQPGDYMIAATAKGFLPSARDKISIASGEQRTGIGTKVSGTVSDVGGGPVISARVTARSSEFSLKAGAELVALTGADGKYELSLPDGRYRLSAGHDDYTSDTEQAEVAGKPLVVDFTLIPGAVIRGVVVARNTRKPVPGAMVQAEGGRGRGRGTTTFADEEGRFVLRGLSSGAVAITARGRGYASSSPTTVQVGIGEEAEDVQVLVDGAFSIIGKVVAKTTQAPIVGARLGGFSMTGGGAEALAPTDADGVFEIAGLRPGSYMIFAAAEHTLMEIGKQVEVVDKDVTGVVIELGTGVTIAGRVEPPGPAALGLELEGEVGVANMFEAVKTMMVKGEADASGNFELANVPPGKFQITARTKEGSAGKAPVTIAAVDQSGIVVMLAKRASIAGRVVDTNGKPQVGIRVMANPEKGAFRMGNMMDRNEVASGPDGTFKIVGLDAGKYDVAQRDFEAMMGGGKDRKKNLVELTEGQERTGVTVTVEARDGVIKGTVIGADGKPAADAWVTASREREVKGGEGDEMRARFGGGKSEPALTGPDGRFTITKLRTGSYTLAADGPRGASRGEKHGVKVGDSAQIQLASLGTLVVTVTQKNQPVKSYDLSCDSAAFDVERHADTTDGAYQLENLPPGEYKCKVDAELGTGEGKVTVTTPHAERSSSDETKLAVSLSVFGSLAGQVVSVLSGKPIPDLDVIVQNEGNPRSFIEAMTGKGIKTTADGKFVAERVPAGKGKLMFAGKAGFGAMESSDYVAKEGERVDLGEIKIVPPRTTEAGTYGFATEPKGDVLEITSVTEGSPAQAAGIVVGDRIVTVETLPVKAIGVEIVKKLLSSGIVGVGQTVHLGLEKGSTATVTSVKW